MNLWIYFKIQSGVGDSIGSGESINHYPTVPILGNVISRKDPAVPQASSNPLNWILSNGFMNFILGDGDGDGDGGTLF